MPLSPSLASLFLPGKTSGSRIEFSALPALRLHPCGYRSGQRTDTTSRTVMLPTDVGELPGPFVLLHDNFTLLVLQLSAQPPPSTLSANDLSH